MPLIVHELPLTMPPIREGAQWHLANNNDAAIRWFVEKLALVATDEQAKTARGNVIPIGGINTAREEAVEQYKVELPPKTRA
jgi:LysR family transcriptional regulator, nod-box dependent transcriptional activator